LGFRIGWTGTTFKGQVTEIGIKNSQYREGLKNHLGVSEKGENQKVAFVRRRWYEGSLSPYKVRGLYARHPESKGRGEWGYNFGDPMQKEGGTIDFEGKKPATREGHRADRTHHDKEGRFGSRKTKNAAVVSITEPQGVGGKGATIQTRQNQEEGRKKSGKGD